MKGNRVGMCFILGLAPYYVATARAAPLSALSLSRDSAPREYSSDSAGHGNSSLSLTLAGHEELVNITQRTRSAFSRRRVSSPISLRVSRDDFQNLAQVVGFRCWDRQVEIQIFRCRVLVTRVCMTDILSRTEDSVSPPVMYCSSPQQL